MKITSLRLATIAIAVLAILALAPIASASTLGTCSFNATTNTLIVSEGPEGSADHGGIDCNLKDVSSGLFTPGGTQLFSLLEQNPTGFPCSDRVDVTNNHVTLISDPSVPDHGLPCTPNRTNLPEVSLGSLGFGANLGNILALCTGGTLKGGGTCTGTVTPVTLIVISDQATTIVPEPGTLGLLGTGLVGIAGLLRRRLK